MKIGLKIWSTNNDSFVKLKEFYENGIIDYVELYIVPNSFDEKSLTNLKNIPIIFHAPDFIGGFNVRKRDSVFFNVINEINKFSEFFNEKRIIIHPGYDVNEKISSVETIKSFKMFKDYEIIIENMPKVGIGGEIFLFGTNKSEIMEVITEINCKFCLDFGHAICSSNYYRINQIKFIEELLELKPYMFHLSDGNFNSFEDKHLSFGEGNFPISKLIKFINQEYLSLETPKKNDLVNLKEDLKNIEVVRNFN